MSSLWGMWPSRRAAFRYFSIGSGQEDRQVYTSGRKVGACSGSIYGLEKDLATYMYMYNESTLLSASVVRARHGEAVMLCLQRIKRAISFSSVISTKVCTTAFWYIKG